MLAAELIFIFCCIPALHSGILLNDEMDDFSSVNLTVCVWWREVLFRFVCKGLAAGCGLTVARF